MDTKQKTKVVKRLNPSVYSMLTGVIFIGLGIMWLKAVNLLIAIDGFGLGKVIYGLPYVGYATLALGVVMIFVNLIRMIVNKPVVEEEVAVKAKKNVDPRVFVETSKFEKKYIKGLVLDLDGTLLNTIDDLTQAANEVLQKMNLATVNSAQVQKGLGNGMRNLIKSLLPENVTEAVVDEAFQDFLYMYQQNYMNLTKPYDGIVEMLKELVKRGYLLAVVSNKKDEFTQKLVKHHFPDIIFVDVIGEKEDVPRKPDPALINIISQKMMLPTKQLAMIGDSEVDIKTAKNSEMFSFAVTWGYRPVDQLKENEPNFLVSSPSELVMQLDMINTSDKFDFEETAELENLDDTKMINELVHLEEAVNTEADTNLDKTIIMKHDDLK